MKHRILSDYLLSLRGQLKNLPARRRDEVLREVEAHTEAHVAELARDEPKLSADERYLRATAAFGDPAEIGFRDEAGGVLVKTSTGDVLLRMAVLTGRAAAVTGKAAGRGARSLLKWTA